MELTVSNEQFKERVKALHAQKHKPGLEQRQQEVNDLIESFVEKTGKRPSPKLLASLADYLMLEILTDQQKHYRGDEYPFHTKKQSYRRGMRQVPYSDQEFDTKYNM